LPGHFVVQYLPEKGDGRLIDVFEGGKALTRQGADKRVQELGAESLTDSELKPAGKKAIVVRMLHNLLRIAGRNRDVSGTLHYLDAILAIDPEAAHDRLMRAVLRYQTGQKKEALADTEWFLDQDKKSPNTERALELRRLIEREEN